MIFMADTYAQLSDYVREKLKARGWSQRKLAAEARVSPDTISRLAKGAGPFEADTLDKIAQALGIDADYLKQLAGVIERRNVVISDPEVLEIAEALDVMDEANRRALLPTIRRMIGAYQDATGLVEEARRARPDLAERAEAIKQARQTKGDKIESE